MVSISVIKPHDQKQPGVTDVGLNHLHIPGDSPVRESKQEPGVRKLSRFHGGSPHTELLPMVS